MPTHFNKRVYNPSPIIVAKEVSFPTPAPTLPSGWVLTERVDGEVDGAGPYATSLWPWGPCCPRQWDVGLPWSVPEPHDIQRIEPSKVTRIKWLKSVPGGQHSFEILPSVENIGFDGDNLNYDLKLYIIESQGGLTGSYDHRVIIPQSVKPCWFPCVKKCPFTWDDDTFSAYAAWGNAVGVPPTAWTPGLNPTFSDVWDAIFPLPIIYWQSLHSNYTAPHYDC